MSKIKEVPQLKDNEVQSQLEQVNNRIDRVDRRLDEVNNSLNEVSTRVDEVHCMINNILQEVSKTNRNLSLSSHIHGNDVIQATINPVYESDNDRDDIDGREHLDEGEESSYLENLSCYCIPYISKFVNDFAIANSTVTVTVMFR